MEKTKSDKASGVFCIGFLDHRNSTQLQKVFTM